MKVPVIELTKDNIPEKQVIAIGYQNECLVGYIHETEGGDFECEDDSQLLEDVTHFIEIPKVNQ